MLQRINDMLAALPATLVGGVFLLMSFAFSRFHIPTPIDPAWVTVIISGLPLLYLALWRLVYNKGVSKISSALLITVAMIAALTIGDLFAAGEVAFIMAIGAILEDMTTKRARKGLKKLIGLTPAQGRKIVDGQEVLMPATSIAEGDILRILPGENIPVDGIIIAGSSSVDQSILTGESLPVDKEVGEDVYCGTMNCFGSIDIRATHVGKDSSLQKLIRMVQEAEANKAPMQRITDRVASWFVPIAMVIAVLTYLITGDIVRAVTVLVVFCPCALVLATPTAIMAAIGQATKHGVIIKSGEALEKMSRVNTVAMDKTGTLTFGQLEVSDVLSFDTDLTDSELLALVASAESKSEHPLAKAIVTYAKNQGMLLTETDAFTMSSGKGIRATVKGRTFTCGNETFLTEQSIDVNEQIHANLDLLRAEGKASVLIGESGRCIGIIALSDVLRAEAHHMVPSLQNAETKVALLTGDNKKTANYFAKQVGIQNIYAELLPEQKVEVISELQSRGKVVCMVGDGVNDAPALKTATVGVAMGNIGSDIAVEAADIALISDDITKIPYLKRLAKATVQTIKFSIALSMIINIVAIVFSILGLLTPTTGALVHNAGSFFVVLIAALLYDRKFEH